MWIIYLKRTYRMSLMLIVFKNILSKNLLSTKISALFLVQCDMFSNSPWYGIFFSRLDFSIYISFAWKVLLYFFQVNSQTFNCRMNVTNMDIWYLYNPVPRKSYIRALRPMLLPYITLCLSTTKCAKSPK